MATTGRGTMGMLTGEAFSADDFDDQLGFHDPEGSRMVHPKTWRAI